MKFMNIFFIRHIFTDKRWLVGDMSEMQKYVGGYGGLWTPKFF